MSEHKIDWKYYAENYREENNQLLDLIKELRDILGITHKDDLIETVRKLREQNG